MMRRLPFAIVFFGLVLLASVSLPASPARATNYQCGNITVPWQPASPDRDCDGFSDSIEESHVGTHQYVMCPATSTGDDETPDDWPLDMNDDQAVNIVDTSYYVGQLGSNPPDPRLDLNADGQINILDLSYFVGMIGKNCTSVTTPPPAATTSRYMATVNPSTLWNEGCVQALAHEKGVVILDFGQPHLFVSGGYGTLLHDGPSTPATKAQIETAAENFAAGYWNCSDHSAYLVLGVGTNNYAGITGVVNSGHGTSWAQTVNNVNSFISTLHWDSEISAVGANDIETDIADGWANATATRQWVSGYAAAAYSPYYNYGDANGCPYVGSSSDAVCQQDCSTGPCWVYWQVSDLWYVSWHNIWAWPMPEIYARDGRHAAQWQALDVYAYYSGFSPIHFNGTYTQEAACAITQYYYCTNHDLDNPSGHGWTQLWTLLNADWRTPQPILGGDGYADNWSTDVTWNN